MLSGQLVVYWLETLLLLIMIRVSVMPVLLIVVQHFFWRPQADGFRCSGGGQSFYRLPTPEGFLAVHTDDR